MGAAPGRPLPPGRPAARASRAEVGHRRYTATDVARLQPVRTLRRVHALSRLEAAERGRLLDRFWDRVTEGLAGSDAVDRLRAAGTPALPADPTGEQPDAGLELAELAADEEFQRTTRANALWGVEAVGGAFDPDAWSRRIGGGLAAAAEPRAAGVEPADPRAAAVADHAWLLAALRHHRDRTGVAAAPAP
jgi:hypothetical protein